MRVFGWPRSLLAVARLGARFDDMSDVVKERQRILLLWEKHGLQAAADAAQRHPATLYQAGEKVRRE